MSDSTSAEYKMNIPWGAATMLISATGMAMVPLFSRWATRTDMFDGSKGLNAGNSVGALMATGRMFMGLVFFFLIVLITKKMPVLRELKVTPPIILGGVMIGLSLSCYVTATLLTSVANAVLLIYTGPVFCVILARIFRKEPMTIVHYVCLLIVFIGMLFGNGLIGFKEGGFFVDFNIAAATPDFPLAGLGNLFGFLSGVFYGASMFFNGYRRDADSAARGVWNFIGATVAAGTLTVIMQLIGTVGGQKEWDLNIHFTAFNWVGVVLLWIICGPIALGFLLVAGRNLPAANYSIIAYWEVPVAIVIGIVVFSEMLTINTFLGILMVIGGGVYPSVSLVLQARKAKATAEVAPASEKVDAVAGSNSSN